MGLFEYTSITQNNGLFTFHGVNLIKMFPKFTPMYPDIKVVVNSLKGTIWMYTDITNVSKELKINEWLVSNLSRTDESKYHF